MKRSIFTRTIILLSLVSLFNDISSEMLFPVIPLYLSSIAISPIWIGVIEGVAEAIAGLSKGYFGKLSDDLNKRKEFVQSGYFLSSVSKPSLIFFGNPLWILICRALDRIGKGLRTGARDAILSEESNKENKSKVFGFHRAFDTMGAAAGPVVALIYLHYHPGDYTTVFILAFIPAAIGLLLTAGITENKNNVIDPRKKRDRSFFGFLKYWNEAPQAYRKISVGFLLFAIANSSDAFIFLLAKSKGLEDTAILGAYIFYNIVYAAFSYPFGMLADRFNQRVVYLSGLLLFMVSYYLFAAVSDSADLYLGFFIYGIFAASTEGISKSWLAKVVPESSGTALGLYGALTSLTVMMASLVAGLIWKITNGEMVFYFSIVMAAISFIYLLRNKS